MKQKNDLIVRTRALVDETEQTHRYSMSRIYGLYNEIYDTQEIPQSCASCLIRKVKQLKEWLSEQEAAQTKQPQLRKKKK